MADAKKVLELYRSGKSTREVASELGCSKSTVAFIVRKAGISRPKSPRPSVLFSKLPRCQPVVGEFRSYLDGLLLSDGFVSEPRGPGGGSYYQQSCVEKEWLEKIVEDFRNWDVEGWVLPEKRKDISKTTGWILRTKTYPELIEARRRWYPDGFKRLPFDLTVASPVLLKNWLYGDGTLLRQTTLRLCTDSFSEREVCLLIEQLNSFLGVKFEKTYMGLSKKGCKKFRPSLCMSGGLDIFYQYLGECELNCFLYKWRKL